MWLLGATKRQRRPSAMEGFEFSGTQPAAFGGSTIPPSAIEAYLTTEYRIWGEWPMVLRIGRPNARLATLYRTHSVETAAVLTAWNPYSETKPDAENHAAEARLISDLDRLGLRHQPGRGADPTGQWPPEDSRLVVGLDLATAARLGQRFGQNGFVWAAADREPMLILLR